MRQSWRRRRTEPGLRKAPRKHEQFRWDMRANAPAPPTCIQEDSKATWENLESGKEETPSGDQHCWSPVTKQGRQLFLRASHTVFNLHFIVNDIKTQRGWVTSEGHTTRKRQNLDLSNSRLAHVFGHDFIYPSPLWSSFPREFYVFQPLSCSQWSSTWSSHS